MVIEGLPGNESRWHIKCANNHPLIPTGAVYVVDFNYDHATSELP
jgi:hypothetical protein